MNSVGFHTSSRGGTPPLSQDIHWSVLSRLATMGPERRGRSVPEILLYGPNGIGKTILLRRLYWDIFDNQDEEVPLLSVIPPLPFRPAQWARRYVIEMIQQWVAYTRRDPDLAQANLLPTAALADLCYTERLTPLAEVLDNLERDDALHEYRPGTLLVESALQTIEDVAARMEQNIVVLIDGVENATWREDDSTLHLARIARPLGEGVGGFEKSGLVRRVWTARRSPQENHPLLPPLPVVSEQWALKPLTNDTAAEFFEELARIHNIDYAPDILVDYLPLWGGIPRWMNNFVRKVAQTPERSLLTSEDFLKYYMADIVEGASSRDLQTDLHPTALPPVEPAVLARVAESRLLWEDLGSDGSTNMRAGIATGLLARGTGRNPAPAPRRGAGTTTLRADEEYALLRLAQAGLAVYERGAWRVAPVALFTDVLRLYVEYHLYGGSLTRGQIAVKRRHLVETPKRSEHREVRQKLGDMTLLMQSFKGQRIPADMLASHLRGVPGSASTSRESSAEVADRLLGGADHEGTSKSRLPHCIGAFIDNGPSGMTSDSHRRVGRDIASVVAWCFDGEGYYRNEEMLWVGHVCEVSVITTEEVDRIERVNRALAHDLAVNRVQGWLLTDARFSPEAIERIEQYRIRTSSWNDFLSIGAMLLSSKSDSLKSATPSVSQADGLRRGRGSENRGSRMKWTSAPSAAMPSRPPEGVAEPAAGGHAWDAFPSRSVGARVVEARPEPEEQVVELRLPPRAGMELVAARTIEEMASAGNYPREAVEQMKMATLEGCMNAIERSRNQEKEIRVRLVSMDDKFSVVIENEGDIFDPQSVKEPVLEEKKHDAYKRGWGLKLIEKFMDRVVFEPYDLGTRLRMEKNKPSANSTQATGSSGL